MTNVQGEGVGGRRENNNNKQPHNPAHASMWLRSENASAEPQSSAAFRSSRAAVTSGECGDCVGGDPSTCNPEPDEESWNQQQSNKRTPRAPTRHGNSNNDVNLQQHPQQHPQQQPTTTTHHNNPQQHQPQQQQQPATSTLVRTCDGSSGRADGVADAIRGAKEEASW